MNWPHKYVARGGIGHCWVCGSDNEYDWDHLDESGALRTPVSGSEAEQMWFARKPATRYCHIGGSVDDPDSTFRFVRLPERLFDIKSIRGVIAELQMLAGWLADKP